MPAAAFGWCPRGQNAEDVYVYAWLHAVEEERNLPRDRFDGDGIIA